jgi:enamine deaminase RidA (YjgF/YER057c/UK114 family)
MTARHQQTPIMHRVVEHNGVLYFGGVVADDFSLPMKGQTEQICAKLDKLLAELGSSREKLLSATLFITDMSQKSGMNEAWTAWIPAAALPARATLGVADLGQGVLIEVVITACQ